MSRLTAGVLEGFVNSVLRKNFDTPVDTPDFHRELWNYFCDEHPQVAVAAPRGHAKSTAGTHAYCLASVLFREQDYVLLVSDTNTQAVQFLGDIKKELVENDDLRSLFGVKSFIKETEDDVICEMDDGHLFRIQAKGSEQKVRGLKWKNKRPGLILMDDCENEELVMNKERREKFRRWFAGALLPCRSVNGKIRIVGTILHLDALLENLMPEHMLGDKRQKFLVREDLKEYATIRLPWKSIKYRAHTENYSKILWPSMYTKEWFEAKREDYARQGLSDVYSQEMLNVPLDEASSFFKKSDFLPMTRDDKKLDLNYYIACDLAISKGSKSDYTVFLVTGMDENSRIQVRNVIRDRLDAMEIVEMMLSLNKLYQPKIFGVEAGMIQKSLGPYLNDAMIRSNNYIPLALLKTTQDKVTRARGIQARMRAGACKFDKDSEWYQTFEDECLRFPRDKHDDQVDAFAHIGMLLDKLFEAPTQQELEEEEYNDFIKEAPDGRCATTGY